jgi:hypothetical protein
VASATHIPHVNLPHLFLRHPNRLVASIFYRPAGGQHHAQHRQDRSSSSAAVPARDRNCGHPTYCLPVRPPEAKIAGRDDDMASLPDRQAAGHHGWGIASSLDSEPNRHLLMHQPHLLPATVRRRHQIHRHPSIIPRDQQSPVADRPAPLTPSPTRGKHPVAPEHHRPVIVAHAVVLESPTKHQALATNQQAPAVTLQTKIQKRQQSFCLASNPINPTAAPTPPARVSLL